MNNQEFLLLVVLTVFGFVTGMAVIAFGTRAIYSINKKADFFINLIYGSIIVLSLAFVITVSKEWVDSLNVYLRFSIFGCILALIITPIIFMIATWKFAKKPSQKTDDLPESVRINIQDEGICQILYKNGILRQITPSSKGSINDDVLKEKSLKYSDYIKKEYRYPYGHVEISINNTHFLSTHRAVLITMVCDHIKSITFP